MERLALESNNLVCSTVPCKLSHLQAVLFSDSKQNSRQFAQETRTLEVPNFSFPSSSSLEIWTYCCCLAPFLFTPCLRMIRLNVGYNPQVLGVRFLVLKSMSEKMYH